MIKDLLFKNWKTTLFGLFILLTLFFYKNPHRVGGEQTLQYEIVKFIMQDNNNTLYAVAILGFLSKDGDK